MSTAAMPPARGPLAGLRIVELASVVLAPWACQILGDLGADVIKVEPPAGDSNRQVGPGSEQAMGALYLTCNRNKRSLVLDLKQPAGRDAFHALLARADVLVHNLRPAPLARLELAPEGLCARYPRLVVCGTYGFSKAGPRADEAAYDDAIQAASGVAALELLRSGEPRFLPTIVADKTTALTVVYAVLAALFQRERSGRGQAVEVPMFETLVAFLAAEHLYGLGFEPARGPAGYPRVLAEQRRPFKTRDGYLALLPYLDTHWRAFCERVERLDLAEDPRFATLPARLVHRAAWNATLAELLPTRSTAEWLTLLAGSGVPMSTVPTLAELVEDEQLQASGFWELHAHPTLGTLRLPGIPTTFSDTPGSIRRLPPRLGEHSREVLLEAGLEPDAIAALLAAGVTVQVG